MDLSVSNFFEMEFWVQVSQPLGIHEKGASKIVLEVQAKRELMFDYCLGPLFLTEDCGGFQFSWT